MIWNSLLHYFILQLQVFFLLIFALLAYLSLPAIFRWCVSRSHHGGNKQQSRSKKQLQFTLWIKLRCRLLVFLPRLNLSSSRRNKSDLSLTLRSTCRWVQIFPHPLQLIWEKTSHKDKAHLLHSFTKFAILEPREWMFAPLNLLISCILAWLVLGTYCFPWFEQELSALHILPSSAVASLSAGTCHIFNCAPFGKRDFQHQLSLAHTPHSYIPSCLNVNLAASNHCPTLQQCWQLGMFSVLGRFCRLAWHH